MKRWLRATLLAVTFIAAAGIAALTIAPPARADINGNFPCPGLPNYPGVGQCGLVGIVPYYFSDFPTESNGSHWHCEAGGVSLSGGGFTGTNGLGVAGLGQVGFAFGSCYFKWPDGSLAPAPQAPGAWRNFLVPAPIPIEHTAGPQPYDQTQDVAPPPVPAAVLPPQIIPAPTVAPPVIVAPVMPGAPELLAPPPDKLGESVAPGQGTVPAPLPPMPAVTDPARGNPDATQNLPNT